MKTLEKQFQRTISQEFDFPTVVTRAIAKKALEQGVRLSLKEQSAIRRQLRNQDPATLQIQLPPRKKWRKEAPLELTADDLRDVSARAQLVMDNLPDLMNVVAAQTAADMLPQIKKLWASERTAHRNQIEGFERRLWKRWGKALSALSLLVSLATEIGDEVGEEWHRKPDPSRKHLAASLFRLHARACQVGSEMLVLLRHGFADGAMARWRTMHEIAATASFLSTHGEAMAERYLLHDAIEDWKSAQEHNAYAAALGESPFTAKQMAGLKAAYDALVAKFGKEYKEAYGWAGPIGNQKQPSFADIEKAAHLDHLRPYYRLAGLNVHATAKGILFRMSVGRSRLLLAGPSNAGLADPGASAALSLGQTTAFVTNVVPATLDHIVMLKILWLGIGEVSREFVLAGTRQKAAASRARNLRRAK